MGKHCQNKAKNDPEFKKKESKRISDLKRQQRASMLEELTALREKSTKSSGIKRQKENEVLEITPVTKNLFKTPQGFGKSMKRLELIKVNLPICCAILRFRVVSFI